MNKYIFIIGCGHSGTTLLNKIIGNHKDIYGISYETSLFFNSNENEIIKILNNFNDECNKLGKKYICEKTPKHVYCIDKMYNHTVKPKIIVITRDGRDVISSLKKRMGNIKFGLNRWIDDNKQWLNHKNKDDFLIFKYEDFIKNKTEILKKICKYLDITYYDDILNYDKKDIKLPSNFFKGLINNNKHDTLRLYQINQPIYDGSNRWLNDLTEDELKSIYLNEEFIEIMKTLGYEL